MFVPYAGALFLTAAAALSVQELGRRPSLTVGVDAG
jgi:hypothetical protein